MELLVSDSRRPITLFLNNALTVGGAVLASSNLLNEALFLIIILHHEATMFPKILPLLYVNLLPC